MSADRRWSGSNAAENTRAAENNRGHYIGKTSGEPTAYRKRYLKEKKKNRDRQGLPIQPEIYQDESFCNLHHMRRAQWFRCDRQSDRTCLFIYFTARFPAAVCALLLSALLPTVSVNLYQAAPESVLDRTSLVPSATGEKKLVTVRGSTQIDSSALLEFRVIVA